jgi:hypothetical protein
MYKVVVLHQSSVWLFCFSPAYFYFKSQSMNTDLIIYTNSCLLAAHKQNPICYKYHNFIASNVSISSGYDIPDLERESRMIRRSSSSTVRCYSKLSTWWTRATLFNFYWVLHPDRTKRTNFRRPLQPNRHAHLHTKKAAGQFSRWLGILITIFKLVASSHESLRLTILRVVPVADQVLAFSKAPNL